MKKFTTQEKIAKYYKEHPFFRKYRGWKIRLYRVEHRYMGTLWYFTCDVRPGIESYMAPHIEMIYDWIDKKIKEGKVQKEDI